MDSNFINRQQLILFAILLLGVSLISACSSATPGQSDIQTAIAQTQTNNSTAQPANSISSTTAPTEIPTLTMTKTATDKPVSTNTPLPSNTQTSPPTPLPIGESITFADWVIRVQNSEIVPQIGNMLPRGMYVVSMVEVTNNSATERDLGGQFFIAKDTQKRVYAMSGDASLEYHQVFRTNAWYLDEIGPSMTKTIPIVFDVSPDADGLVLYLSDKQDTAMALVDTVGGQALELPGDVYTMAGWSFVVTNVETASSIGDTVARGSYIIVNTQMRNDGNTPRDLGSDFFLLKDDDGRNYQLNGDASLEYHQAYETDAWYLEDLNPSLIGSIPLAFDVSPDATGLTLEKSDGRGDPIFILDSVGGQPITLNGELYQTGDWEFAIRETDTLTSIGDESPDGQFFVIIIEAKNLGLSPAELGRQDLLLEDNSGRTFEMDSDASLEYHQVYNTNAWYLEVLNPSLSGIIPLVFDIPADAVDFALVTRSGTSIPIGQ